MAATSTAIGGIKTSLKAMFGHLGEAAKSAGTAAEESLKYGKTAILEADKAVTAQVSQYGGWGEAMKGVAAKHPVSAFTAGVGAVGATAYAGSRVFGKHTQYVEQRRAQPSVREV